MSSQEMSSRTSHRTKAPCPLFCFSPRDYKTSGCPKNGEMALGTEVHRSPRTLTFGINLLPFPPTLSLDCWMSGDTPTLRFRSSLLDVMLHGY